MLASPSRLHGRDDALRCLSRACLAATQDAPGWLVCGPAGIGRTALLRALTQGDGIPHGHALLVTLDAAEAGVPGAAMQRIRASLRPGQRVVLVDDLHHADPASLENICDWIADPGAHRLACIASCDSAALGRLPALKALETHLQSCCNPGHVLALGPLTEAATAAWLGDTISAEPRRLRALATILVAKTDGNPRDTLAFLDAALRDGFVHRDDHGTWGWDAHGLRARPLAESVADMLLESVPELDDRAYNLLLTGATLGERFPLDEAVRRAALGPEAAADALDELLAHGYLRREGAHMLAFQHPRLRPTLAALRAGPADAALAGNAPTSGDARFAASPAETVSPAPQSSAHPRLPRVTPAQGSGLEAARHAAGEARATGDGGVRIALDGILEGMEAITAEHDRDTLLERVMTTALASTDAERGVLLLIDAGGSPRAEAWAAQGDERAARAAHTPPFGVPGWVQHRAAHADHPLLIEDAAADARLALDPEVRLRGIRSVLCVPLLRRGVPMGTLYLENNRAAGLFSREQARMLGLLACQAAVALENARLYAEMDAQIRLRTAQLEEALALAEEATRAKSDFLANMSHEIRTPMNAIIGMSELAMQVELGEKARGYVGKVHRAAENLLGIINEILDFSKIEAGMLTLEQAEFDLGEVLDHLAGLFAFKAADRGLELAFEIAPDLPTRLVGDALRLGQILTNLVNNAIKFTSSGSVLIGFGLVAREGSRIELHCRVQDTGIGMTAEQCARLFQSFSQAEVSISRRFGGTGLGLAISKKMVEAMSGRIWAESTLGAGSTFHFQVRLGLAEHAPLLSEHPVARRLHGRRVLVVSTDATVRKALVRQVRSLGLECEDAASDELGLALVEQRLAGPHPCEVVLLDTKNAGSDDAGRTRLGVSALQALGAGAPATVLLAVPGQEDIRLPGGESSAARVLHKPVLPGALLRVLEQALLGSATQAEDAAEPQRETLRTIPNLRGLRVLLVEDNDMNQELAMELLLSAGIHVDLAENGLVALERLAGATRYDGVLMDCQMPLMDGYTATRQIRANPALCDLPVVAMTANATMDERDKVIAAGMNDLLFKPLNVKIMFDCISRWFSPQHRAVSNERTNLPHMQAAVPAALQHVPGIDTARGLATCMNLTDLYWRQLQRFATGSRRFAAQFDDALNANDQAAMSLLAHTLKSTASSIGATSLASAAAELEAACLGAAPGERIDRLRSTTLTALERVQQALDALAPTTDTAADDGQVPQSAEERLAALHALVAESDAEAAGAARELLATLSEDDTRSPSVRAVCAALERFDYDTAEALLAQLTEG